MKRSAILALVGVGALVLTAGCGAGSTASSAQTVWATVQGHKITQQDVRTRVNIVKLLTPQSTAKLTRTDWVGETQELVDEYIVGQLASKAKFTLTKAQQSTAQSQLMSYLTQSYGSTTALDKAIKADNTNNAQLNAFAVRTTLLDGYLAKVVSTPFVTSAQIQSFYKANISQFQQPEEYDLAHILVTTKAKAQSILTQLQAGASFSALAKKYSTDTGSASKGGDLGYAPLSNYVTAFANAAKQLTKVGQISGIVHSQYGYHIIKLLGIHPATTQPLSAVTPEIQSYLQSQNQTTAQQKYIARLRTKVKVKLSVPKKVPTS